MRVLKLLLLVFIVQSLAAQNSAKIQGRVLDTEGLPISEVLVFIQSKIVKTQIFSDEKGEFTLVVPAGHAYKVTFSYLKVYKHKYTTKLVDNQTYRLPVVRFASSRAIRTVEIKGESKNRGEFVTSPDPKKLKDMPTVTDGIEELLKLIAPGMQNMGSELSSSYNVRGGNFDENLVYINDVEVYRPFLVRSGQQEGLSIINPDLIDKIAFSAGGFQAKYGDKLSSVLDIAYRQPDSFRATAKVGLLGASFHAEGRTKSTRWSFLTGARYRSNAYLLNSLDQQGEYKPRFIDIQNLVTFRFTEELDISLLTTVGENRFLIFPQSQETSFGNVKEAFRLYIAFSGQELMQYYTVLNALNLKYKPNKKTILKLIGSKYLSEEKEFYTVEGAYRLNELENNAGSDNFAEDKALLGVGYFLHNGRNKLKIDVSSLEHKGSFNHSKYGKWQWGAGIKTEKIVDNLREWKYNDSSEYLLQAPNNQRSSNSIELEDFIKSKNNLNSYRLTGYVEDHLTLSRRNNLKMNAGVRSQFWSLNEQVTISPRFLFSWQPNKFVNDSIRKFSQSLNKDTLFKRDVLYKAAIGVYHQPPFYREMRNFDGVLNKNLKAQRSIHFVFGADVNFKAWDRPFKYISEIYYKKLDYMVPYIIDNVRIRYYGENTSTGFSTGWDHRINGEFIKGLESWINFSVMNTNETITYVDENGNESISDRLRRPTDQRINASILFQDELKRNPMYRMHLNLVFGSGVPYFLRANRYTTEPFKIPAYRRADIGFSRLVFDQHKGKKPQWLSGAESFWVSLEVFNLLQINNTISYFWIKNFTNNTFLVPNYLTGRRINLRMVMKI